MQQIRHSRKIFFSGRGFATGASLILALLYSHDLGIINRSILAFIMTINALSWVVLTSGTTLTLRKLGAENNLGKFFSSFSTLILVEGFIAIIFYIISIQIYSHSKNYLPASLFWTSIVYVCLSGVHLVSMEVLIALKEFKLAGYLDVLTLLLQFFFYLSFKLLTTTSLAVDLLLALSLSYFLVSIFILKKIVGQVGGLLHLGSAKSFWGETRGNHSLGTSLGLMDRSDRLLIGVFLATPVLGKYAVASSLIALLRFLPDAFSKILVAKHFDSSKLSKYSKLLLLGATFCLILFVIEASRVLITFWLGSHWLVSLKVCLFLGLQELLRGWYQVSANRRVSQNKSALVNRVAIALPFLAIFLSLCSITSFGLISIPVSFCIGYGAALVALIKLK